MPVKFKIQFNVCFVYAITETSSWINGKPKLTWYYQLRSGETGEKFSKLKYRLGTEFSRKFSFWFEVETKFSYLLHLKNF